MTLFTNHCYCTHSNWGGVYDCRYILTINQGDDLREEEFDPNKYSIDWTNVLDPAEFFDEESAASQKKRRPNLTDEDLRYFNTKETFRLKPEVLKWLEENVKDRVDDTHPKGWAVGNDAYNERAAISFNIFFHRKTDAMKFIKKWGQYPKPRSYFNYFSGKRYELNLKKMRLSQIPEGHE